MKKLRKVLALVLCGFVVLLLIGLCIPTWTPAISGENSVSTLELVNINGAEHALMIRGNDTNNPLLIFVHGGPGCSEIPYVVKYQNLLERQFTIVQYDQRGSGKSHRFSASYSSLTAGTLVDDLLVLTDYVKARFHKGKVLLVGHSFGTYLAMQAAAQAPENYYAYIGIGQMADTNLSERASLDYCLEQAKAKGDTALIAEMEALREDILSGQALMPRAYIRRYGGTARRIDEGGDYLEGFLLRPEYNLLDVLRYARGVAVSQEALLPPSLQLPLPELVTGLEIPCYFVMGKYDYMTAALSAKAYFDTLTAPKKEFVLFEDSAHYPQFEEKERFSRWMTERFAAVEEGE